MSAPKLEQPDLTVHDLLRQLRGGQITGRSLHPADRQRCVEYLTSDGRSVPEIATILGVGERTIHRDRHAIRKANAVHRDDDFVAETVGQLLHQAEASVSRIQRAIREKDVPAHVKVSGEQACWSIRKECFQTLQRVGYLPTAPEQIQADLTHRVEAGFSYQEACAALALSLIHI